MDINNCYDLEIPPDVSCIKYGNHPIEGIMYTKQGHPLVVVPPLAGDTITLAQKTSTEIARRMALSDSVDEKIFIFEVKKGQMPFSSPVYKTDPHRNVKILSEIDTQMKFEWSDYRDNDELYDFYSKLNDGRLYLAWGKTGKKLIGGFEGILGSFTANSGNIEGAEMNSQIKAEFNWVGNSVPKRISIV
jgi:hypothetical protein